MSRRSTGAIITLGSSGAVAYERIAHDDVFALVRDNEPELTQLFAEGRFGSDMFASDGHPLIDSTNNEREQQWLASGPVRRSKPKRKRAR